MGIKLKENTYLCVTQITIHVAVLLRLTCHQQIIAKECTWLKIAVMLVFIREQRSHVTNGETFFIYFEWMLETFLSQHPSQNLDRVKTPSSIQHE